MDSIREAVLLYAVTDRAWTDKQTLSEQTELALKGGVTMLQLREKDLNDDEFLGEAFQIQKICKNYNVPFIINDNVEVALKCGADGIHIGQSDMEIKKVRKAVGDKMIVGVSAQTVEQAIEAENNGADYLGVGAVFTTLTKPDADFVPLKTLNAITDAVNIPVVAIGGINKYNIPKLKDSGIDGIALVSGIFAADDIEKECKFLKEIVKRAAAK